MKRRLSQISKILTVGFLAVLGCSEPESNVSQSDELSRVAVPSELTAKYMLPNEPEGVGEVIQVRASAEDGQDVVIVGRIGGNINPWVERRAAFWIVDQSLKACSDIPGDMCPKPWDYCCETDKLPTAIALVKVVDEDGALLNYDARDLLNVKELSTVVVQGTAQRDEAGNLTVLANGVHIRE